MTRASGLYFSFMQKKPDFSVRFQFKMSRFIEPQIELQKLPEIFYCYSLYILCYLCIQEYNHRITCFVIIRLQKLLDQT